MSALKELKQADTHTSLELAILQLEHVSEKSAESAARELKRYRDLENLVRCFVECPDSVYMWATIENFVKKGK